MKKLILFPVFLLNAFLLVAQNNFDQASIEILPESSLTISGEANIKEFTCEFNTAYLEDCRDIKYRSGDSGIEFQNAVLKLRNNGFDCGNRAINKDFHDLLQSEQYPEIVLRLNKIELEPGKPASAAVSIFIAGKQKDYRVPVTIKQGLVQRFSGKLKLNIKDFDLEAPKKMFGIIVVKNDIEIDFDLSVKVSRESDISDMTSR